MNQPGAKTRALPLPEEVLMTSRADPEEMNSRSVRPSLSQASREALLPVFSAAVVGSGSGSITSMTLDTRLGRKRLTLMATKSEGQLGEPRERRHDCENRQCNQGALEWIRRVD